MVRDSEDGGRLCGEVERDVISRLVPQLATDLGAKVRVGPEEGVRAWLSMVRPTTLGSAAVYAVWRRAQLTAYISASNSEVRG